MVKCKDNLWDLRLSETKIQKSILSYPGGKTFFLDQLIRFIPNTITELVSPFTGGASLELAVASAGIRVYGNDLYVPLATFWKVALLEPENVADYTSQFWPMTRDKYHEIKEIEIFESDLQRAGVYFAVNKSSFSGMAYSSGYGNNGESFSLNAINRLRNFKCPTLSMELQDFNDTFKKYPDKFMYLDPPYMIKSKNLYGKNGSLHRHFDHKGLYSLLKNRSSWIMSYDNNPEVKELYKDFRIYELDYRRKILEMSKSSTELIIVSNDINIVGD